MRRRRLMKNSISQSSSSKGSERLKLIFKKNKEISNEIADAELYAEIASSLYRLRKDAGLLQKQLADDLGVQQSNISRYETPGYSGYTIKLLRKYVRKLNADLEVKITKRENTVTVYTHVQPVMNRTGEFHFLENGLTKLNRVQLQSNIVTTITKSSVAKGAVTSGNK